MLSTDYLKKIYRDNEKSNLEDYFTFLRFKSITTDSTCHDDVIQCSDWLVKYLQNIGLNVEIWNSDKTPIIFASNLSPSPEKETVLLYCHYDVQPCDPLDEWISPPFEPTLRDEKVFARGASDNKGQCFYTLLAIKTLISELDTLPVNLKFIIEGEEESGSGGLLAILNEKKQDLKADSVLIIDSGMYDINFPAIALGARGIIHMNITLTEGKIDLHSGCHGGMAYNPNRAIAELLASMHDTNGRITIPGFYEDVEEINPEDISELSFDPMSDSHLNIFGYKPDGMEKGYTPWEANWLRPTLDINGITGGYGGEGYKTVIPAKASAKFSCRLVLNQQPEKIISLIKDFLISHIPSNFKIDIQTMPGHGCAFKTSANSRITKIISDAFSSVFQKPCKKILIGASVPITSEISKISGADTLLVGVALLSDQIHAPNEHFDLSRLEAGYLIICEALQQLGTTEKLF